MPQTDDLLSAGDVAAMFGVASSTVATWADQGKLASIRTPGGHRRFRRSDVEALLVPAEPTEVAP